MGSAELPGSPLFSGNRNVVFNSFNVTALCRVVILLRRCGYGGQAAFVTALCRVVTAFVTDPARLKCLIDNICDGVTLPDPWREGKAKC
jgi:hypothetical protein